ncbi:hypothetical protein Taro_019284, partial [Colocasia esculenta]|nr:hypothetical protein [Colocasia esculenta]
LRSHEVPPSQPPAPSLAAAAGAPRRLAATAAASSFFLSFSVLFSLPFMHGIWHIKNMKSKRWSRPLILVGLMIRRDYSLPINVDDDEDDDDDPNPEFTAAARASRRSYAEKDDRRKGLGTSGSHLSRDDSRRSLHRSTSVRKAAGALGCGGRLSDVHTPTQGPMDTYLYRSRSVKQLRIKQALKEVKATAKAVKGAIKGIVKWFLHADVPADTTESPYFQTMLDAIAEAGFQYKDNVHNDGEVMRGTMNVITRLARTMNERLDAMAEVERYRMKLGIYGGYDMRCAAQRLTPVEWWIQVNYQQAGTNPLTYVRSSHTSQYTRPSKATQNQL